MKQSRQDILRTGRQERFAAKLRTLLDAGRGTEAVNLFCRGAALGAYTDDETLRSWLNTSIGDQATRQLVTLFAVSPCAFCRRGLEPCADCDKHGHFGHNEICETCLGLGACRCQFCNGSGLSSSEAIPRGLRVPVAIERAGCALQQIQSLSIRLSSEPETGSPHYSLKEQAALILRLNGLLGTLENEFGDDLCAPWWTPRSSSRISRIIRDWPRVCRRAEERVCEAFQSMSQTAMRIADDAVDGSTTRSLALARAAFFQRFVDPESLDRTSIDHPILDRIVKELGDDAAAASGA